MSGMRVGARRPELFPREEMDALARRVLGMLPEPWGEVVVSSSVRTTNSFARGDTYMMTEHGDLYLQIILKGCTVGTSRYDDAGLKEAIAEAMAAAKQVDVGDLSWRLKGPQTYAKPPQTFYASTEAAREAGRRAELHTRALDATEKAKLIGAGDIAFVTLSSLIMGVEGLYSYREKTYGEFSLTARTPDGTGSGWGWSGYEDWSRVNTDAVIARALDLAQRSKNPVAVEPGRYTVILEPTATAAFLGLINWSAFWADQGNSPFSKSPRGTNKIGLQMLDPRLGMRSDPWDPEKPDYTASSQGEPLKAVQWFDRGFLRELDYDSGYAKAKNREPTNAGGGLRLFAEGPTQTLDEMIASTKRGIWVNRLSGIGQMYDRTGLLTGTTRDGTFLIENGKITKAIKNFRFTESPFFVLNKVEAVGEPVRASEGIVAPRIKVRDFDFTSLTDAV